MTYKALITTAGKTAITEAEATSQTIGIVSIWVGDGGGAEVQPPSDPDNASLVNKVYEAPINSVIVDPANASQIRIEAIIPESVGGFWVRECAAVDSSGNILVIANCPEAYKPQLAEGAGKVQVVRIFVAVDNTGNFTIVSGGSSVLATRDDLSEYVSGKHGLAASDGKGVSLVFQNGSPAFCYLLDGKEVWSDIALRVGASLENTEVSGLIIADDDGQKANFSMIRKGIMSIPQMFVDPGTVIDDGVYDCYDLIKNMLASAGGNSNIFVPVITKGIYYLSANPWPLSGSSSASWKFSSGVRFTGPGAQGNDLFRRLRTNGWLIASGDYGFHMSDVDAEGNPPGGAIAYDTIEVMADNNPSSSVSFSGMLTKGSSTISSISAASLASVKTGFVLSSSVSGFPVPSSSGNGGSTVYVGSIGTDGQSLQMLQIVNNAPSEYIWPGDSQASASIVATNMKWSVAKYTGMDSGWCKSPYMGICGENYVLNINPGYSGFANGIEVDINNSSGGTCTDVSAFFATGAGNSDNGIAFRAERTNNTWRKGMQLFQCQIGVDINAQSYGVRVADTYRDASGGTAQVAAMFASYWNPIAAYHNILQATQIVSGSDMVQLFRKSDATVSDTGRYIACMTADGKNELFLVKEDGTVSIYGPNTGNGSTTNSGGLSTPGVTIQKGSNLQLGNAALTGTVSETHTLTLYDENGVGWKVNVGSADN